MATLLTEFYPDVRAVLGDRSAEIPLYEDTALRDVLRAVIRMGKVTGVTLAPDLLGTVAAVTSPNQWALVVYSAAKLVADARPDRYSYKRRAMGESFGSWRAFSQAIDLELHRLENGTMFLAWGDYYTWLQGIAGLPLRQVMAEVDVTAPFSNVTVSASGVSGS